MKSECSYLDISNPDAAIFEALREKKGDLDPNYSSKNQLFHFFV